MNLELASHIFRYLEVSANLILELEKTNEGSSEESMVGVVGRSSEYGETLPLRIPPYRACLNYEAVAQLNSFIVQ